jgi:hypothetical protein
MQYAPARGRREVEGEEKIEWMRVNRHAAAARPARASGGL